MRRLGSYEASVVPAFADLVADSTPDRKAALEPLRNAVKAACAVYDAVSPELHALRPIQITKHQRSALIDGYDHRTVAMKRRLAKMIDSLPKADADLCPYCSLDTNPDLDHFLPKARFPEFSLHARNLVPICTPCNRKKLNAFLTKSGGQRLLLHPSAEPSNDALVLRADLGFSGGRMAVSFCIDDSGKLSKSERQRVEWQFARLGLGARYTRRANSYLASFKASIAGKQKTVVARTLKEKINTSSIGEPVNGWRPALYRAIILEEADLLDWLLKPAS